MALYRIAGQLFTIYPSIADLSLFEVKYGEANEIDFLSPMLSSQNELISKTEGWVGGTQRKVEVYRISDGILLKVEGGGEFFVSKQRSIIGKRIEHEKLSQLDREVILGPVLVFALALRGVWSLHASAAMYKKSLFIFLGESGRGKSTLAAYLSQSESWRLVADDILPIKIDSDEIQALPYFPQLKLPSNSQPSTGLPESIPLKCICELEYAELDQIPDLQKMTAAKGVQYLLEHTAGTRLFDPVLLAKHLEFSAQTAKRIPTYRLIHPHRRDTLPLVRGFLENLC